MKKLFKLIFAAIIALAIPASAMAAPYLPYFGGTGTSTAPNKGDVLVGNANGTYDVVATSTLGIIPTWGSIKGTLSSQTDLLSALNSLVPYSGATGNVDLGSHNFNAQNIKVNGGTGHGNSLEVNGTAEANYFNALSFGQVIDNNANAHFHTLNLNSATAGTVAGFDSSKNIVSVATTSLGFPTVLSGFTNDVGFVTSSFSTTSAAYWLTQNSTTNLSEGTNLYFTNARVNSYIAASTTMPKTYSANTWTALNTFNGGVTIGSLNGPLQANAGVVSATTSIGPGYGGTGITSPPTYGQLLVGNSSGGYNLTATSSLNI